MSEVSHYPCLRLNVPELYEDKEFMAWLNTDKNNIATWHRKGAPNDCSDVFIWYDSSAEGSDSDIPEHWWGSLVRLFEDNSIQEGIAWLTNLDMENE